jgi:uncharacterized small protein (DUF1192 family)
MMKIDNAEEMTKLLTSNLNLYTVEELERLQALIQEYIEGVNAWRYDSYSIE